MRPGVYCIVLAALLFAGSAQAHSTQSGDIMVGHVWAYETDAKNSGTLSVFVPFLNKGKAADAVTGADSPAADKTELVASCKAADAKAFSGYPLPPNKPVALSSKGPCIRLSGMKRAYKDGDSFPITFHFQHARDATIDVMVQAEKAE